MRKKSFVFFIEILLLFNAFAFEKKSVQELLLPYIESDVELNNLAISVEKSKLSNLSVKIDNGINLELSTGNVILRFGGDNSKFQITPSAKISLPQAQNLGIAANSQIAVQNGQTDFSNTSISLNAEVIGESKMRRNITVLKSERQLVESERALKKRTAAVEKEFYTELKELLSKISSILSKEDSLYTDKINFEKIKAQGYSSSSSTYRLAQMKVYSDTHDIQTMKHSLIHSFIVFYKKCGFDIEISDDQDFLELIPTDIPLPNALNAEDYDKNLYIQIESAVWNNKINSMEREVSKFFTLSANGGYTFNNTSTDSNTVDAGVSSKIGGATVGAGVSIPVSGDSKNPAVSLSATVVPNNFRKEKITKQINIFSEQQELLAIETANQNYETSIVDSKETLSDINWQKQTLSESYDMYCDLEKDMALYFKNGIISESEYLSAKSNMELYKIKLLICDIDLIIYNSDVQNMFVSEN